MTRKERILLLGSPLYGYHRSVKEAIINNNCDVDEKIYFRTFLFFKIPFIGSLVELLLKKIIGQIHFWYILSNHEKYDILLFFGYYLLSPKQIVQLKTKTNIKTVFWAFDSIHSKKNGYSKITCCDYIFLYNKEDEDELKKNGHKAKFLPLCYDEKKYYKIENKNYLYDIYFIGALRSRIVFLEKYLKKISHIKYKIRIDGKLNPLFVAKNKNKFPNFFKYYTGQKITSEEINLLYNSSRICLNIQPNQATSGFSIRTFEINGAGGLQLTNGNKNLLKKLYSENSEYLYYNDIDELVEITNDVLSNYSEFVELRTKAHQKSLKQHTYSKRVHEILTYENILK